MRNLFSVLLAGVLTAGCAGAPVALQERPDTQPGQYSWDLKCLAADQEIFRQAAIDPATGSDAIFSQLRAAAIESGAANGKDSETVLAEARSASNAYRRNPRPYYGMTAVEMRGNCITALMRSGGVRTWSGDK